MEDTPNSYVLEIESAAGTIVTPNLRAGGGTSVMYNYDMRTTGTVIDIPVGRILYRVRTISATSLRLYLLPADLAVPIMVDVKRFAQFDTAGIEGPSLDSYTLSAVTDLDVEVYSQSREINFTRIRQQDPDTLLWSLCDVHLFPSGSNSRVSIWIDWIATGVAYS